MLVKRMPWSYAAQQVLQDANKPLTGAEIARIALENGWVVQRSQWPSDSVRSAIIKHVRTGNAFGFKVFPSDHAKPAAFWLLSKGPPLH